MSISHTETLRRFINQIIAVHQINFPFSKSDLEVVRDHASILGIRDFMEKKRRNQISYANLDLRKQIRSRNTERGNKWVVSFLLDLEELFKVPELNSPRNVQVASFIAFLVKLLNGKPHLFALDAHLVITELRSFNTILLDSPFQSSENHLELQTLLSEFETLANYSGKLVYSFLFSPDPPPKQKIDELLLEDITRLKDKVIKFFNSPLYNSTPNTLQFSLSSVLIVESFLSDLENFMIRDDNSILEVKTDVEKLHRSIKHSWSLLNKDDDETDELKQTVMLVFDAKYLVDNFLCGDAPAWYLALRLPLIIHRVELVGSRLLDMVWEHHDDQVLQVGDDFAAGLPLQTGKSSGKDGTMDIFGDEEKKILPREVNFSHAKNLCRLINQIIASVEKIGDSRWNISEDKKGERESVHQFNFPFSKSDLEVVRDHASILDIRDFMEKKRSNQNSYANSDLMEQFTSPNEWVGSFLQDLEEVFKVPKLNQTRNVQVASFMGFLVQLLIGKPHFHLVITELRFFNTILLDSPFRSIENLSEVQTLVSQFESLANECGRLVYSFLFSRHPRPINQIDEILSEPIILLKDNVIKFFNSPSYINTTPNTLYFAMSSVFIVDSFLNDLENLMDREDNSILEVRNDVEKLHGSLKHSWSLLSKHYDDTDELKQIVMMAFDAEFLVNYFLCGDAPAWYLALRLPHIIHSVELIGSRLQDMVRENHDVDRVLQVREDFGAGLSLQTGISSEMDGTRVGFEDEEQKILYDLVGEERGLRIISIIGMAGVGKTTLAKKIYNHPTVRDRFDKISWCIVSQSYEMKKLLVEILMCLDSRVKKATLAGESEDEVGLRIYITLRDRRYFIVVDDIWELRAWYGIKRYLPDDGIGSRILLTSRNKEVADQCNSTIHALPLLSNDQCWELLQKNVFHGESGPPELQHTGAKIAAQCNGLPLVVVVVARILWTIGNDLSAWEKVSQTLDSSIMYYQDGVVAKSLECSYMNLPDHLKPCFLYFGRFQEDERIIVNEVVRLWIAEGFIPVDKRYRAEDIAKEYMKELIDKNLIMVAEKNYKGEAKVCTMHALLRVMCLKIADDDNFMIVADGDKSFCDHRVQRMIFHSSLSNEGHPDSNGWFQPYSKYIRSFVCGKCLYPQLKVGHMKVLRVLGGICGESGIQNLIHLRYLNILNMPEPIGRFSSLEFLVVATEVRISSRFLDAMMKLRYLRADKVYVDHIDCNTPRTYNLEYISNVIISSQEHAEQLKVFPNIRKIVCRIDMESGFIFDLSLFIQLESLTVHNRATTKVEITFPSTIIKLSLNGLVLSSEEMSTIGALPKLEVLKLFGVWFHGEKWETRDDEFQKLKYLKLELMHNLVEWEVSSWKHFPVLRHLIIKDCYMLEEIPIEIGFIMLQRICVRGWSTPQLKRSVNMLKEDLQDLGNEDATIVEDLIVKRNSNEVQTMPSFGNDVQECQTLVSDSKRKESKISTQIGIGDAEKKTLDVDEG